jgi:hypothetical protein
MERKGSKGRKQHCSSRIRLLTESQELLRRWGTYAPNRELVHAQSTPSPRPLTTTHAWKLVAAGAAVAQWLATSTSPPHKRGGFNKMAIIMGPSPMLSERNFGRQHPAGLSHPSLSRHARWIQSPERPRQGQLRPLATFIPFWEPPRLARIYTHFFVYDLLPPQCSLTSLFHSRTASASANCTTLCTSRSSRG